MDQAVSFFLYFSFRGIGKQAFSNFRYFWEMYEYSN